MNRPPVAFIVTALTAIVISACGGPTEAELMAAAKASIEKKEPNAAIVHLKAALQKNEQAGEGRYLLGKLLLENGDAPSADVELSKALVLGYDNDAAVPLLARAWLLTRQYRKLIDNYANTDLE